MRKLLFSWTGTVVLGLAFLAISCSNAAGTTDGGELDGDDGGDVDPCVAAQGQWNEIWQSNLVDLGLEGQTPDTNMMDVWGESSENVYAVGFNGTIMHYDGTAWTKMESGTTADLEGVWGYTIRDDTGALTREDVFAVGSGGTILRYNGINWSPALVVNDPDVAHPDPQAVNDNLHDVWGIAANGTGPDAHPLVVAVGSNGTIVRYDGPTNRFVEMRERQEFTDEDGNVIRVSWVRFSPERLGGVFASGSLGDPLVIAVGNNGTILEMSGDSWNRNENITPPGVFISHLNGVWGRGSWEVFATGIDGTVLRRDNGGTWHRLQKENPDLWTLEPIYLRGVWGFFQSYCGEYPEVPDGGEPPDEPVRQDTSWVILVGWDGTVYMGHDGLICQMQVPTSNRLEAIWGVAPRSENERWIDGGTSDGGVVCDPVEVIITGVNGTMLRLFDEAGR